MTLSPTAALLTAHGCPSGETGDYRKEPPKASLSLQALSQVRRHHKPKRPLAILLLLPLLLSLSLACSGGGSANRNLNSNSDGDGNSDANQTGPASNEATATTPVDPQPGAPANLIATANSFSQIDLTWQTPAYDGGSPIIGYQIEYREGDGDYMNAVADTGSAETSYSHIGLRAETTYSYRVYAINADETGPASNEATAATPIDPRPGAPANPRATANGSSQIDLTWTAPAYDGGSPIIGYQIEYREGDGDWMDAVADTGSRDTSYSHAGLGADTEYSYRIYAINADKTGLASDEATAATISLAEDPKPGAPINLMATPREEQITLSWDDPIYCGNGNLCSETAHQHWLEYKLASADDWGSGEAVADSPLGSPHSTTHTVTGLANDVEYHFRLAVQAGQLDGDANRSPWATKSAYPGPNNDGDGEPDSIDPDDDNDGVMDTSDAFPLDGCASVDADNDGFAAAVIAPEDSDTDGCIAASPLLDDVDDDNDGLIEIASRAELDNIRHNLAGSSYDDEESDTDPDGDTGDSGDTTGAPMTEPTNCDDVDADGDNDPTNDTVLLCGYELANDIDLDGIDDRDDIGCKESGASSGRWIPIGDCGSDGTCGETDDPDTSDVVETNDDAPFTAIFEGNGFGISNLCIEGDGDATDIDALGLFGHLGGATVRNLAIAEVYIEASFTGGDIGTNDDNSRLGVLAGYVTGDTAILNVAAEDSDIDLQGATTADFQHVGGLVGLLEGGSIIASFATGDVSGGDGQDGDGFGNDVGGLVGRAQEGATIIASFATGTVSGGDGQGDDVGGLVGLLERGSIIASFATGNVSGGDGIFDNAGGLVGNQIGGGIVASFATGNVEAGVVHFDNDGSLVGFQSEETASITVSYGFGAAAGSIFPGSDGSSKPTGAATASDLTGDLLSASYAGSEWSSDVWDFGDSLQAPALKYISSYMRDDGDDGMAHTADDTYTYSCDAVSFPPSPAVTCGTTLLPGQGR